MRAAVNDLDAEILFFQSDYENLLGRCRVSDQNCTPGDEFNGGNVMTEGVEFSASLTRPVLGSLVAKGSVSYTYTEAIFESSFFSNYIAWGIVQIGDQLPYIPEHSGVASVSLESEVWSLIGSVKFQELSLIHI